MEKDLKYKGFNKWLSDYSESYHHLKGWRERDNYLDEVELPDEILFGLIQKWLREDFKIIITIHDYNYGEMFRPEVSFKDNNEVHSLGLYNTYELALELGILDALKSIKTPNNEKNSIR